MNEIKGFFQRLKDACMRLMPSGHGDHFVDTLLPHSQDRRIAQGNGGSYNSYAGGRRSGRMSAGAGSAQATPAQQMQALTLLKGARAVNSDEAESISDRIWARI